MEFKLFRKFAGLEGVELILFLIALAALAVLGWAAVRYSREHPHDGMPSKTGPTRALVYGALMMTASFVLSYFKLFSMPFGGSVTLFSMLPLMLYAYAFGPRAGFLAAGAYAVLQIVQGAYIVHPVQFVLDYFVAFLCLGVPSLFPKSLPLGIAVGGCLRTLASTVSGAVFFADGGLSYGIADPWVYSFLYNLLTIGVDTLMCFALSLVPSVRKLTERMK